MTTLRQRFFGYRFYWRVLRAHRGRKREALTRMWCGDFDRARWLLEREASPDASFALACLELEVGNPGDAARHVAELPDDPTRAVLSHLVELAPRREDPYRAGGSSWHDALVEAWRRAGCPDLHDCPRPSHDFEKSYDVGHRGKCPDSDARAVWMWTTARYGWFGISRPRLVEQWASAAVDRPLPDLMIAAATLWGRKDAALVAAYQRTLARLRELAPTDTWIRIVELCRRREVLDEPAALDELAAIADSTTVDANAAAAVYARVLEVARSAGSHSPDAMAFAGWLHGLPHAQCLRLLVGLGKTPSPRAAELCIRLGHRLLADRHLIGFLIGAACIRKGARALGDQRALNELAVYNDEIVHFGTVPRRTMLDPSRWPIPSLAREGITAIRTDEVTYQRAALRRELAAVKARGAAPRR